MIRFLLKLFDNKKETLNNSTTNIDLESLSINNKNRTIYYEAAKEYMNRYPSLFENFVNVS